MGAGVQELGPYRPVEDELVLAAVDRVLLHRQAGNVWLSVVAEHFGFEPGPPTTRRMRAQLEGEPDDSGSDVDPAPGPEPGAGE